MTKASIILACSLLAALVFWFVAGPIPQDQAYHAFADSRTLFGIANFWNVVTNLPVMISALAGLWSLATGKENSETGLRMALYCFFLGVCFSGAGSTYYHLAPDDTRLFWDRLPMTVAFMGLFASLLYMFLGKNADRTALVPLLVIGPASVILWRETGDLRLYALVQFLPIVVVGLFFLAGLPCRCNKRGLLLVFSTYGVAKACELSDLTLYQFTGILSGHSFKHLTVAAAVILVRWTFRTLHLESQNTYKL